MQPEALDFVIPRHCVPSGPKGLSPLQHVILHAPERIRILSAPTGAGKSYAFRRAVTDAKARVLFVVPTRRLAQNLAQDLIKQLEDDGASPEQAKRRVNLWTSDEVARRREADPDLIIGHQRIHETSGAKQGSKGDMIIATPESVAYFIARSFKPGAFSSVGLADFILNFDHIVFDEFHAIEARGFGLAAAFSLTASLVGEGGAKVTFLSATPIAIRHTLEKLGVPPEKIREESETVLSGPRGETGDARALHGDVSIHFAAAASLIDLLEERADAVAAELAQGRQIVLIYDSVAALLAEKQRLVRVLAGLGVSETHGLSINSVDDSSQNRSADGLFDRGAALDPKSFRVLVATSTVELGVTFRAGLMLMDSGFDEASFVQRIGRVARGDEPGTVVVRLDSATWMRKAWLRSLHAALKAAVDGEGRLSIDRFMATAMASAAARFRLHPEDDVDGDAPQPKAFRSMPARAVWCAGLFWRFLETPKPRPGETKPQRLSLGQQETLKSFRPKQAKKIGAMLRDLEAIEGPGPRLWAQRFREEALRMRVVPKRVKVIEPGGGSRMISFRHFESLPELLRAPQTFDDAADLLCVRIDRSLEEVFSSDDRSYVAPRSEVLFPDRTGACSLEGDDVAGAWLREAGKRLGSPQSTPQGDRALTLAIDLVRKTRLVPGPAKENAATPSGLHQTF